MEEGAEVDSRLIRKLSWRRNRRWIDHVEMVTKSIEVIVQHINMLLKVILSVLDLLILLMCGQGSNLCTESINIICSPC